MKRIIWKFAFFLPVLILFLSVNYWVDPANRFSGGKYERGLAELVLAGKHAANVTDYDERVFEKFYIAGTTHKKDLIVLGSSRTLPIGAASGLFRDKNYFNNSVSGASLEDLMAIYSLWRQKGLLPSAIVLGLDPWMLNRNSGQARWRSLQADYDAIEEVLWPGSVKPARRSRFPRDKLLTLFSISYFQAGWPRILSNDRYYPTTDLSDEHSVKLADGSLLYDKDRREIGPEAVRREAIHLAREEPVYSLGDFSELDADAIRNLEAFLGLMKSDGVKVVIYLPPYHPVAYQLLVRSSQYKIIEDAQKYYRRLAKSMGIRVLGSYDPIESDANGDDFQDGMHIKPSGIRKILSALDRRSPA